MLKLLIVFFCLSSIAQAEMFDLSADIFAIGRPEKSLGRFSYSFQQTENTNAKSAGQIFADQSNDAALSYKFYQKDDVSLSARASVKEDGFETKAVIPVSRQSLSMNLWNPAFDLTYSRKLENERFFAQSMNLSSPSNKPFARSRDYVVQTNSFYKIPAGDKKQDTWLFLVNFSNNRSSLNYIPLPGFAYYWNTSDDFKLTVGLPFFFLWCAPFPKTMFTMMFLVPRVLKTKFSYFIFGPVQTYLGFQISDQNYMLENRSDKQDRLYYEKRDLHLGISSPLSKSFPAVLDLSSGYQFGQRIFQGKRLSDRDTSQRVELEPAFYGQAKVSMNF